MAARRRRGTGKPPEEKETSKVVKKDAVVNVEDKQKEVENSLDEVDEAIDLPFKESENMPSVGVQKSAKGVAGFQNRAPLQADERARELLRSTLQHPISLTAEDLLNVSEPVRNELKKLLTKRRIEKKSVHFAGDVNEVEESWRNVSNTFSRGSVGILPEATCEILEEDRDGMKMGDVIIGDPVLQYLAALKPGEKPKPIAVARESQGLRAIYPLINRVGETECLLDSGSQIISMGKRVAEMLEVEWDPGITIEMESANRSVEKTLGLARNVPFSCGNITVYLQVHILFNPAYKVLMGRPFDTVTESLVKNEKDGSQCLTLTDPTTGERCVMPTYERGRPPEILKRPVKEDFRYTLRKQC